MRICSFDGRLYSGTPLQIVRGMRDSTSLTRHDPIPEYVKLIVDSVVRAEGTLLQVEGENDEELATSLVEQLIKHNIVTRH